MAGTVGFSGCRAYLPIMSSSVGNREIFKWIEVSPIAGVITDATADDNPIVAVNEAFVQLTGYTRDELLGRNCRLLAGPGTSGAASAELSAAVRSGSAAFVELMNYRRDGSSFLNAVMIAPVLDEEGRLVFFVGSQMDVGATGDGRRHQAIERVGALTPRQRDVLRQMARGLRNKQIAVVLGINEKTVKMHRAALLGRLKVATSADAIRVAVQAGL